MDPHKFLSDLERKPEVASALADRLSADDPWPMVAPGTRIVFLGMGSSAYAAGVAAARLRARGHVAVSELASTDLLPAWTGETVVIATSATGGSKETLDALGRLPAGTRTIALTNTPGSAIAERCDHTVLMHAEPEVGGVACRSYQHTLALLLALEARLEGRPAPTDVLRRSAEACADLLSRRPEWLPALTELVDGPSGAHLAAPARRFSSAQQSALMLREGPRRAAIGCEVGDWAHVDVYLTKTTDYRLVVFAGSNWDDGIREWTTPRHTRIAAVGGHFDTAELTLRYAGDSDDEVRLLTETLPLELVAAHLWSA